MLGGFPSLLFSEAWSGSIGGGLAIGGVRVGFVSGLDGFALLGRCVARVSRLGEDEGELESTTYCTCVRAICSNLPMTPDFLGACLRNNVLNYNRLDQGYYYDIPHIKAYYPRNRSKHDAISL